MKSQNLSDYGSMFLEYYFYLTVLIDDEEVRNRCDHNSMKEENTI